MKTIKFVIITLLLFLVVDSYSQSYKKKSKNSKPTIISLCAGVTAGEHTGLSSIGPYFMLGIRKTVIRLGNNYNFSLDFNVGPQTSFIKGKYIIGRATVTYPMAQITFNFNALAGAMPPTKKAAIKFPVGLFLGPGVYLSTGTYGRVVNILSSETLNYQPRKISVIDVGPMINFGFRVKLSKRYFFDLRAYGAFTLLNEITVFGGGLCFPVNLGKYANKR